jgi:hypothetical protein
VIPVHCEGCGLTIHPGAMRRDLGYLVARSCPRCARPLSPPDESRHEFREAQGRRRKQLATALPDTYQGNYTRADAVDDLMAGGHPLGAEGTADVSSSDHGDPHRAFGRRGLDAVDSHVSHFRPQAPR